MSWDGDRGWAILNDVIAVSLDQVKQNFANYGLLDESRVLYVHTRTCAHACGRLSCVSCASGVVKQST
jgi:hypothetical protein